METHEIGRRFKQHFISREHAPVPSASLILDDPDLLFVNAGMVPFKPYFLGEEPPAYRRATSIQKCLRTNDIAEVGKTTRHNTFFQMCGNFSFGDYFKEGAIEYAWSLIIGGTAEGGLGFDPNRIWVTVFHDDDETAGLWQRVAGLPATRIQRRGMADNYWSMGVPGPCGPCSEIYYDRGPDFGREGGPIVDEGRYIEIWNLVFMQNLRGPGPAKEGYPILGDLPAKNIDTGMGIERAAMLLQDVANVYETDLIRPIIARTEELTGQRYGKSPKDDVWFRIIADHARSAVMVIADGVVPSNEGRGYVLRRLLRRTVRSIRLLGVLEPVMGDLTAVVRDVMSPSYPELIDGFSRIDAVGRTEEESFLGTLSAGSRVFDAAVRQIRSDQGRRIPGDKVFQLHDTYGFPVELTLEMAAEAGLTVDESGFHALMARQRAQAKADATARKLGRSDPAVYRTALETHGRPTFLGYQELAAEAEVTGLVVNDTEAVAAGVGAEVTVIISRTPFYAEGGGQQPDHGIIRGDGWCVKVDNVQQPLPGLTVHHGTVAEGEIRVGAAAWAEIDADRRAAISRSHTATHLVHAGMRRALGDAAAQAGSMNGPGRLRFDFTSPVGSVPASVLGDVEDEVNAVLAGDYEVRAFVTTPEEARRLGALALFGERYGTSVRVVEIADYSRELCGGTHVHRSGQLGLVKLLSESSIGSGVRRVEALVGLDAFRFLAREHVLLSRLAETFRARPEELPDRIGAVVDRLRSAERELEGLRDQSIAASAESLAAAAEDVAGIALVAGPAPDVLQDGDLYTLANQVRERLGARPGAVALFHAVPREKARFVVATTKAGRERGLSARHLVAAFAPAMGGRGGGTAEMANGGGGDPSGIPAAVTELRRAIAASADSA